MTRKVLTKDESTVFKNLGFSKLIISFENNKTWIQYSTFPVYEIRIPIEFHVGATITRWTEDYMVTRYLITGHFEFCFVQLHYTSDQIKFKLFDKSEKWTFETSFPRIEDTIEFVIS